MKDQGWIKLHRSIKMNSIYQDREPFCKRAAWMDILLGVNHSAANVLIGGREIVCNAGESLNSLDTWAQRWRWDKSKVRRYFNTLRSLGMIETKSESKTTRLTVCNWASYQNERHDSDTIPTRQRHDTDTIPTPNKNERIIKNDKNENPKPQAAGTNFEKLANAVGPIAAKLLIESNAGEMLPATKKKQLITWLKYRREKGWQLTTTFELSAVIKEFQEATTVQLEAAMQNSFSSGYKKLVIEAEKANGNDLPANWYPGIEQKLNLTPEQTNDLYAKLLQAGWKKIPTPNGIAFERPRPASRSGETSMNKIVSQIRPSPPQQPPNLSK